MGIINSLVINAKSPPTIQSQLVAGTAGVIYRANRFLGSSSTFSLVLGSDNNLSIDVNGNTTATTGIASGNSQIAVIRESTGFAAIEYPVKLISS